MSLYGKFRKPSLVAASHIYKQTHNQWRWRIFEATKHHPDTTGLNQVWCKKISAHAICLSAMNAKTAENNRQTRDVWCLGNVQLWGTNQASREMIRFSLWLLLVMTNVETYKRLSLLSPDICMCNATLRLTASCHHCQKPSISIAATVLVQQLNVSLCTIPSLKSWHAWQAESCKPVLPVDDEIVLQMLHNITWVPLNQWRFALASLDQPSRCVLNNEVTNQLFKYTLTKPL